MEHETANKPPIFVDVEFVNYQDEFKTRAGTLTADKVRRETVKCSVECGAMLVCIPDEAIAALGLNPVRESKSRGPGGEVKVRRIYGPVRIHVMGRENHVLVTACDSGAQPVLGQIALLGLDLAADWQSNRLVPVHAEITD